MTDHARPPSVEELLAKLPQFVVSDIDDMLLPNPVERGDWIQRSHVEALLTDLLTQQARSFRDEQAKAERVFQAVVYAYEGKEDQIPDDLQSHGFVNRGRKHFAQQARRGPTKDARPPAPRPCAVCGVSDAARHSIQDHEFTLVPPSSPPRWWQFWR